MDSVSSLPEVHADKVGNICSMIHRRIHSTGTDPVMAQPRSTQSSFDEDFIAYVPEELIEHPDDSVHHVNSFVAATEAGMWFSAALPLGGHIIASSSEPVPCSIGNRNDITNITNIASVENMGSVNRSTNQEGAMSRRG